MNPQRIKILFVETYRHAAGGQRGLLDLVQHLDKTRFDPVVLIQGPGNLKEGLDQRRVRHVRKRLEPFKNRWLPFSWMLGVFPVMQVLRDEKPDIVHSNHLYVGRYSGRAAQRLGIPSLVTLRLVHEPEIFDRYNRWETLRCHSCIVSNSDRGREVFESDPEIKAKIITIKNGMDLERFSPWGDRDARKREVARKYGMPEDALVITQIASMVPQKGNEDLLKAFSLLAKKYPRAHLMLVGGAFAGTDNSPTITQMAEAAGIAHRVHMTNYVWDVVELLNLTDISVLASRDREGLPRSIIEAMACANPVVGTDVGGMRELIRDGENGFLISTRNTALLADRLDMLLADETLRHKLGTKGLEIARENHDIRGMMRSYEKVYLSLVEESRSGT